MPESEQERPNSPSRELKIKRPQYPDMPLMQQARAKGFPFLHKALLGLLIVWLLFLGFMLLDPLPFLFPGDDNAGAWRDLGAEASAPSSDTDRTAPDHPELAALKQTVAAAILAGSLDRAMTVVQQQRRDPEIYPYPDALTELAQALRAVKFVNTTVADIVRGHIGNEILIRIKNKPVKIMPRASAGERVNALIVTSNTNQPTRSITFNITDLAPLERARWIGEANSPIPCLMKLYLHLEAGDRDGARAFAPSCGILADALAEQLRSESNTP